MYDRWIDGIRLTPSDRARRSHLNGPHWSGPTHSMRMESRRMFRKALVSGIWQSAYVVVVVTKMAGPGLNSWQQDPRTGCWLTCALREAG